MTSIPTTLSVSHKPTPASEPASAITQPMHVVVVCAGTHSAVHTACCVGRVLPYTTSAGVHDGDWAAKAGHCEGIIVILCLAVPVAVRARSQGLSDAWGKDRGGVGELLVYPEKGRVVVPRGDEHVAKQVEYKHSNC
jgi:hypothetical protein